MNWMPTTWGKALIATALLASVNLAVGCAAGQGLGALHAQADPVYALLGEGGPSPGGAADAAPVGGPGRHHLMRMARQLGLTEAQRGQLKALMRAARGEHAPGPQGARREELRALMGATQVDALALDGWLRAREQEAQARLPERVALAGKLRAVLTEEQRGKLVELLGRTGAAVPGGVLRAAVVARLEGQLKPSPAQKEAWQALRAKLEAWRDREGAQHRAALQRFVQDGKEEALLQAWRQGLGSSFPRQELIAVVQGLSLSQRQELLALAARRMRGAHPHGGHQRPHGSPNREPQG